MQHLLQLNVIFLFHFLTKKIFIISINFFFKFLNHFSLTIKKNEHYFWKREKNLESIS